MLMYESRRQLPRAASTSTEWNILWAYERNFGVRQAALYTSYGTWPEDYCLQLRRRGRGRRHPADRSR